MMKNQYPLLPSRPSRLLAVVGLLLFTAGPARAQDGPEVYATDLASPIGLAVDARGWVWVAEQGTGETTGRISVITRAGDVHPFLTGLRSISQEGGYESAQHLLFHDGALWITYGLGAAVPEGYLLRVDTTGFTPGDAPRDVADTEVVDVSTFVLDPQDPNTVESNPYNLTVGPDDHLYITDSAADRIIRYDHDTADLTVFATFDNFPNPTPIGPPFIDVVPTGIVYARDRFYVSVLSGFPFLEGMARVFAVDREGNVSLHQGDLTLLTDLAVNPLNGNLVTLQIGVFGEQGFVPGTGRLQELRDGGEVRVLAEGLNLASGMAYDAEGNLFVSDLFGMVWRLPAALITDTEPGSELPAAFCLDQNYPNPFNPRTTITYSLNQPAHVVLSLYNILGQKVTTLVDGVQAAGPQSVTWDARDAGRVLPSGTYLYRLQVNGRSQSRTMLLLK